MYCPVNLFDVCQNSHEMFLIKILLPKYIGVTEPKAVVINHFESYIANYNDGDCVIQIIPV